MHSDPPTDRCPCGSPSFVACCGPILAGADAPTAEALMRSRYTAFSRSDAAYLAHSWAPEQRPATIHLDRRREWTGLEIVDVVAGRQLDATGIVEFVASYRDADGPGAMRERST
ncbi:MAG: YchJ family metal-binding protein, partial [Actinomycetota bacterium]